MMTRLVSLITVGAAAAVLLTAWALTIDGHFSAKRVRVEPGRAAELALRYEAKWEAAAITATDGVALRGWLFTPEKGNGRSVVLVHGRGAMRQHMLGRAGWFLAKGYACLVIDQRGCGESGGAPSLGAREPDDVRRWAEWVRLRTGVNGVFGYGASRGSTTLVQSLGPDSPFDGIAVESVGVGETGQLYRFVGDYLGIPERAARWVAWPLIEPTLVWVRVRHGIDLPRVRSGVEAIQGSRVPVLIVQGAADENTPLRGAERLRETNPGMVRLVVIPGANHEWFSSGRAEVEGVVMEWMGGLGMRD